MFYQVSYILFGYPAPGYRGFDNGTLYHIGQYGYSWSSSVPAGGFSAYYLNFSNSGIYPHSATYRAVGFPVRCLLE